MYDINLQHFTIQFLLCASRTKAKQPKYNKNIAIYAQLETEKVHMFGSVLKLIPAAKYHKLPEIKWPRTNLSVKKNLLKNDIRKCVFFVFENHDFLI
jgi:hypothetical protein